MSIEIDRVTAYQVTSDTKVQTFTAEQLDREAENKVGAICDGIANEIGLSHKQKIDTSDRNEILARHKKLEDLLTKLPNHRIL